MKSNFLWLSLSVAFSLTGLSPVASGVTLPLNGTWIVADEVPHAHGGYEFSQTWTIEATTPICLTVTDVYVPGDVFAVFANGLLLGQTDEPDPRFPGAWADTPDQALVDEAFSQAKWLLDPGTYAITLRALRRPALFSEEASTMGLSATQIASVPESGPAAVMLGLSLIGLATARRILTLKEAASLRTQNK